MSHLRRLRWRLSGALQWPAFVLAMCVDSLLLAQLPPAGQGAAVVPAVLLAALINIVVLAALAPLAALALRRRLPRAVARDRAAASLLALTGTGLLVAGLIHRPEVEARRTSVAAEASSVRRFLREHAPNADLARMDTLELDPRTFRTCVPVRPNRLCLIVDTSVRPPRVSVDSSATPNAELR